MNILLTTVTDFFETHHAFNLERLDKLARKRGFYIFAQRCTDKIDRTKYTNVYLTNLQYPSSVNDFVTSQKQELKAELMKVIQLQKPKKIMCLIDIFSAWELVPDDIEKVIFVRNTWQKVFDLHDAAEQKTLINSRLAVWAEYEKKMYETSNATFVTDSPNSMKTIKEYYGVDVADIVLPVINPKQFKTVPIPSEFSEAVYTVGRMDYQKGLHRLRVPQHDFAYHLIGDSTVDQQHLPNFLTQWAFHGQQPFSYYKSMIKHIQCGIFPAFWESNGYAVQECLAMGKVPLVQFNSGGNTEYIDHMHNGFMVDFDKEDWSTVIMKNKSCLRDMAHNARETISQEMYEIGVDRMVSYIL